MLVKNANDVSYLEPTVTPTNDPSNNLFRKFTKCNGCEFSVKDAWIAEDGFPLNNPHELKCSYCIGPMKKDTGIASNHASPNELLNNNIDKLERSASFDSFVLRPNSSEAKLSHTSRSDILYEPI